MSKMGPGRWLAKLPKDYGNRRQALHLGVCATADDAYTLVTRAIQEVTHCGLGSLEDKLRRRTFGDDLTVTPTRVSPVLRPIYEGKESLIQEHTPMILEPSECIREVKNTRSSRDKAARREWAEARKEEQRASNQQHMRAWLLERIDAGFEKLQTVRSKKRFQQAAVHEADKVDAESSGKGFGRSTVADLCHAAFCAMRGAMLHGNTHREGLVCPATYLEARSVDSASDFLDKCVDWHYHTPKLVQALC